jgi:transcriptional regulator with XRE-family HTH domain
MTTHDLRGPIGNTFPPGPIGNTPSAGTPVAGTLPRELAEALRAARIGRGWSLRQAAGQLGTTAPMVCRMEHGDRRPSVVLAAVLIAEYRLTPDVAARLLAAAAPHSGRSYSSRGRRPHGDPMDAADLMDNRRGRP